MLRNLIECNATTISGSPNESQADQLALELTFDLTSGLPRVLLSQPAWPPFSTSLAYVGETVVTALLYTMPPYMTNKVGFLYFTARYITSLTYDTVTAQIIQKAAGLFGRVIFGGRGGGCSRAF